MLCVDLSCHSQKHIRSYFSQDRDCQLGQAAWAWTPRILVAASPELDLPAQHHTLSFFLFPIYLLYLVCINLLPVCIYVYQVHACRFPGTGFMDGIMWVLGIEPRSFARATSLINSWAFSPAPIWLFINTKIWMSLCVDNGTNIRIWTIVQTGRLNPYHEIKALWASVVMRIG